MIQGAIEKLMARQNLARNEVAQVMGQIADGGATPAQVGAFLTALRLKGETAEEITGAAEVMRARVTPVRVEREIFIDTCGTGGDGSGTFNISTAAAFVASAAGVTVAKHGNRSVSSRCGSADVLAELGVNVAAPPEVVARCIHEVGIGFLFAPQHHPAFKNVAAIRRELGVRTVFNLLGPLANPAGARRQVMGVFAREWVPVVAEVLRALGAEHAFVVHGEGLDEITVTGATQVAEVRPSGVRIFELAPEELGLHRHAHGALRGGSAAENAAIIRAVLGGQAGAPRDAVVANAAAALVVGGAANDLVEAVALASEAIDSGRARATLDALKEASAS